jgi:hypothetical protein
MSGTKKFIASTDRFLDKASKILDDAVKDDSIDATTILPYLDVIYRAMQSIKLMQGDKGKKKDEDGEISGKSLADRMSKNGN